MKTTKKILSVFLALLMIISIIPMSSITVSAANGIQSKIDLIRTIYDTGSYFTSDGKSHNMWDYSVCPEDPNNRPMPYRTCKCSLSQQTKKTTGLYSGAEVASKTGASRWQCAAFATYVFYNIFNKDYGTCGTVSIDNAKLGDVVVFDFDKSSYSEDHYAIYLYTSGSNVYVYDANSDYNSQVVYGKSYAKSAVVKVFRASNYDSVNGSPTTSINYVTGLAGQYYLESKDTGYWLSVSESKDASTQPINTWGTWWENFRVKLVASGNGYKINFPLVSSLLMNPYSDTPTVGTKINLYKDVNNSTQWWGFEKVGDAYAIRCLYNPSLVLTSNGTAQATLTTYTGASNQLWYLHPYSYTVSFNANGGSGAPSSQTKYFNESLTLSSTKPTRSGYTFLGWSTSSTATSASYSAGSSFTTNANTTLYAVWKEDVKTYTISYNANGGTGAPSSQTKYHDTALILSTTIPTRSGYTFRGWAHSSTADYVTYSAGGQYTSNSSTTLYAVWKPNEYTVSYSANGGTGAPSSQTKYHNQNLALSSTAPTRIGYIFVGWGTSAGDTTVDYYAGGTYTQNSAITLYAIWKATSTTLTANSSNDAVISSGGEMKYYTFTPSTSGKYVIYSTSSEDTKVYLYNLAGTELTYDDDSGENRNFRLEYEMTAGTTYQFRIMYYGSSTTGTIPFKFGQVYTVSYHANGGTSTPSSQNKDYGATLTLSSYVPTRSGYTFLGWSTSSTATTATYQPGVSFTTNANTTLYAVWQKNAVAEPEIHVSSTSVNLTLGETENIDIYAWATDIAVKYKFRYEIKDANLVACNWGDWTNDMRCPLTITAKSKGTTTVTVLLIDYETQAVLDSITVTVNVGVNENYVDFSIKEPSTTTIRYKDGIALHIDGYIPDSARVEWAIDSNAFDGGTYDNGMSCLLVSQNNGYATVIATLYDANGNVIATDSVELRSNAGFFQKIGGFFRSLFGTTTVYDA